MPWNLQQSFQKFLSTASEVRRVKSVSSPSRSKPLQKASDEHPQLSEYLNVSGRKKFGQEFELSSTFFEEIKTQTEYNKFI